MFKVKQGLKIIAGLVTSLAALLVLVFIMTIISNLFQSGGLLDIWVLALCCALTVVMVAALIILLEQMLLAYERLRAGS